MGSASRRRAAVELLPPLGITGIGSLPHSQRELALQCSLQVDVPWLPQLPRASRDEYMVPAALDGLPGLQVDDEGMCTVDLAGWEAGRGDFTAKLEEGMRGGDLSAFEPTPQACRAWHPFLYEVQARGLKLAKAQLAGPVTLRWVTKLSDGRALAEEPSLDRAVFRLALARGLAMTRALRRAGATPLFFLDEPGLFAFDGRNPSHVVVLQELRVLASALQHEGALVGLHCCSNTDWGRLLRLGLDILAVDARLSLDALVEERAAFLEFLSGGGTLALGVIPTDVTAGYRVEELADAVEATLRAVLPPSLPLEAVLKRLLLTPACGLGLRTVQDAERILGEVREAQARLRACLTAAEARP